MPERSNIYTDMSYYPSSKVNSEGYISFTTSARQIVKHLNSLNATLQQLDQDLLEYRKSVKADIYQKNLEEHLEDRVELIKKIQAELEVYHFYWAYTLQTVCQNFCYHDEHNK